MNNFISRIALVALVFSLFSNVASASLSEAEVQYLNCTETGIQSYVDFSTNWTQNFLSVKNNESYAKHVDRFKTAFGTFEKEILYSLRTEKTRAGKDSEYGQAITLTHDIVSTLYNQAKHVLSILEKHGSRPNPISLIMDLRSVEKYDSPSAINTLQSQLKQLQTIFNKIYQSLAEKIGHIIRTLEQRKTKKVDPATAMQAIMHRVKCK